MIRTTAWQLTMIGYMNGIRIMVTLWMLMAHAEMHLILTMNMVCWHFLFKFFNSLIVFTKIKYHYMVTTTIHIERTKSGNKTTHLPGKTTKIRLCTTQPQRMAHRPHHGSPTCHTNLGTETPPSPATVFWTCRSARRPPSQFHQSPIPLPTGTMRTTTTTELKFRALCIVVMSM